MPKKTPVPENVTVNNQLSTVPDTRRATDLFGKILRAVRKESEDERKKDPPAAA